MQCLQALHEKDVAKQQMRERALDPGHNGGHIQGVRSIPPSLASGLPYGEVWVYNANGIVPQLDGEAAR